MTSAVAEPDPRDKNIKVRESAMVRLRSPQALKAEAGAARAGSLAPWDNNYYAYKVRDWNLLILNK